MFLKGGVDGAWRFMLQIKQLKTKGIRVGGGADGSIFIFYMFYAEIKKKTPNVRIFTFQIIKLPHNPPSLCLFAQLQHLHHMLHHQ